MTLLQTIVDYFVKGSPFINKNQIKGRNAFPRTDCKSNHTMPSVHRSLETEIPTNNQQARLQIEFFNLKKLTTISPLTRKCNSVDPISRVGPSRSIFSRNSPVLLSIICRSPVLTVTKIVQKMWKVRDAGR